MTKKDYFLVGIILIITSLAFFVYWHFNYDIDYTTCIKCDGREYVKMFHYFRGEGNFSDVRFPFYQRMFVPWLASILPFENPVSNFRIINLVFTLLTVGSLFYLWKKLKFPTYLICLALVWFVFHFLGIIREHSSDSAVVDVPTFFFQTLLVFILISRKWKYLWVLGPIATLQKESFLAIQLMLFVFILIYNFFSNEKSKGWKDILIAIGLTLVVQYIFIFLLPRVEDPRNSLFTLFINAIFFLIDPLKLVRWNVALCMCYGAFLFLTLIKLKKNFQIDFFSISLILLSFLYFFFGLFAGGDTARILMLGFPFIMTYCLLILRDENRWLLILSCLPFIPAMRLLSTMRNPVMWMKNVSLPKDYYWSINFYADMIGIVAWGMYFLFCYLFVFYLSCWFNKKEKNILS